MREDRVDQVGHGFKPVPKARAGGLPVSRRTELGEGDLGSAVDADERKELAPAVRTSAMSM